MNQRMRRWRPVLIVIALASVALSLINASWLAPRPEGHLTLVADRGVGQQFDRADPGGCTAARILAGGDNVYIENTARSLYEALKLGAQAVEVQVQRSRDGQMVLFADPTLDCRTNGHGAIRDHDLAELKALDIGYGYTSDGGRSFPLRGRGVGAMPTIDEVLRYIPTAGIVFALQGSEPADADALIAAFGRAGVKIDEKYGFVASGGAAARIRQLAPGAWVYDGAASKACLADYVRIGWTSIVPASCRGITVIVPLDERWKIWGWPYRFFDRMAKAHSKLLIYGHEHKGALTGLDQPEQYDKVPADFHGHLFVEDIYDMGPALRR